jgi:hypothetical protein
MVVCSTAVWHACLQACRVGSIDICRMSYAALHCVGHCSCTFSWLLLLRPGEVERL